MGFDTLLVMDIVIIVFGLYVLYVTLRMKKTGKIDKMILQQEDIKKVKNQKDFVDFLFPRLLIFDFVVLVDGILGIVCSKLVTIPYWNYIEMVSFVVIVIVLGAGIRKARTLFM